MKVTQTSRGANHHSCFQRQVVLTCFRYDRSLYLQVVGPLSMFWRGSGAPGGCYLFINLYVHVLSLRGLFEDESVGGVMLFNNS